MGEFGGLVFLLFSVCLVGNCWVPGVISVYIASSLLGEVKLIQRFV